MTGLNYSKELQYMPIEDDMHRGMSRESSSPINHGDGSGLSPQDEEMMAQELLLVIKCLLRVIILKNNMIPMMLN